MHSGDGQHAHPSHTVGEQYTRKRMTGRTACNDVVDYQNVVTSWRVPSCERISKVSLAFSGRQAGLKGRRLCSVNTAEDRDLQMLRNEAGQFHGLVETTRHLAPPVQWHGQHAIDVLRELLAGIAQDLRKCRSVKELALEFERFDSNVDRKFVAQWCD